MVINNDINDFLIFFSFRFYNLLQHQPRKKFNHVLNISHIWRYNFFKKIIFGYEPQNPLSVSVFPPVEYGTPSLSASVFPVQENEKPSSIFGQVSCECHSSSVSSTGVANRQVLFMRKNRRELVDRTGEVCMLMILDIHCGCESGIR